MTKLTGQDNDKKDAPKENLVGYGKPPKHAQFKQTKGNG